MVHIARMEAAGVYDQASTLILSDLVELIATSHRLHCFGIGIDTFEAAQASQVRCSVQLQWHLTQYAQYTTSVIEGGIVGIDVVRATLQQHTFTIMLGVTYECDGDPYAYDLYLHAAQYFADLLTRTCT